MAKDRKYRAPSEDEAHYPFVMFTVRQAFSVSDDFLNVA